MSDWWESAPLVNPQSSGQDWWKSAPVVQSGGAQPQSRSWGEVAIDAATNLPGSAWGQVEQLGHALAHPVETAGSIGRLANAVEDKGMSELGVHRAQGFELTAQDQAIPGQIVKDYVDHYGGVEAIKKTIAEDPMRVLMDFSTALTGGGAAASRLPGIAGKVGEIAMKTGDISNPFMGPVKAVGAIGDEAARLGSRINAPTTEALYDAASAAYDDPAIKGIVIKPSAFKTWKDTLLASNDVVDEDLSPKTFNILKRLDNPPAGSFFDGRSIQSLRRKLGQAAGSVDATERKAARDAIESLDDFLGSVPKSDVLRGDTAKVSAALEDARGNYAAAKRSDLIEGQMDRATLQAGSANSGMNVDNATRQRLKDILNSDKRKRGFSADELAQMREIVTGSPVQNTARRVGNMLGGGGGIGSMLTSTIGAGAGGAVGHAGGAMIGAAIPATVGYGLKRLSAAMTQADVQRLQELVRSRSPLGQQMQSSLGKFGKAATMLRGAPSAKTIARFMLASKNLSSNLSDAGIDVPPESIIGSIDGTAN